MCLHLLSKKLHGAESENVIVKLVNESSATCRFPGPEQSIFQAPSSHANSAYVLSSGREKKFHIHVK
jgi:hypothetical protein